MKLSHKDGRKAPYLQQGPPFPGLVEEVKGEVFYIDVRGCQLAANQLRHGHLFMKSTHCLGHTLQKICWLPLLTIKISGALAVSKKNPVSVDT